LIWIAEAASVALIQIVEAASVALIQIVEAASTLYSAQAYQFTSINVI